jgi:hypothetical protein
MINKRLFFAVAAAVEQALPVRGEGNRSGPQRKDGELLLALEEKAIDRVELPSLRTARPDDVGLRREAIEM